MLQEIGTIGEVLRKYVFYHVFFLTHTLSLTLLLLFGIRIWNFLILFVYYFLFLCKEGLLLLTVPAQPGVRPDGSIYRYICIYIHSFRSRAVQGGRTRGKKKEAVPSVIKKLEKSFYKRLYTNSCFIFLFSSPRFHFVLDFPRERDKRCLRRVSFSFWGEGTRRA